ncbi:metallophosphoesterase [Gleimia hominis]|uniref:Metallophosphoesterase n=1 Tax=Gleimia hominis TaxID=595468 RepID=A0ABU3IB81_9ACTO|nr:metallophosphoesterase [Gleimia hominis]MDT3767638.1 metallophosphoesterase [Gleimia hominis]
MRIIQISEFHLRSDGKLSFQKCDTRAFVAKTIDWLRDLEPYDLPDYFVVSGDLAEGGTREGLAMVREELARLPRPAYVVPGNHDDRNLYLEMLPDNAPVASDIAPYICYTVESQPVRSIFIDTSLPGKHWGGLADPVADWLEAQLDKHPKTPTIVFGHHPPFESGLPAMDEGFENRDRMAQIFEKHKDHIIYCCGHLHTPLITTWHGVSCRVSPAVCMQMEVDFRTPDSPDVTTKEREAGFKGGGDRFYLANPACYIHNFVDGQVNTHYVPIPVGADYSGPWPFKYYEGEH